VVNHGRAEGMLHLAKRLKEHGDLRPGMTVKEAADRLWVITSFDTFDQLYSERGLSRAEVAERLVGMAERAVCA